MERISAGTWLATRFLVGIDRYNEYMDCIIQAYSSSGYVEANKFLQQMIEAYPEEYAAFMARERLGIKQENT